MPIYVAVIYGFIYPLCATCGNFIVKYSNKTVKITSIDFAISFSLVYSIFALIAAIVHFSSHKESFELHYFIRGFFVSFITIFGAITAISALNVDG